jgi:hypothetical protein
LVHLCLYLRDSSLFLPPTRAVVSIVISLLLAN